MARLLPVLLLAAVGCIAGLRKNRRNQEGTDFGAVYAVNHSSLQTIESRVSQAKTQQKHRKRVRQHFTARIEARMAERLATHMRTGRLQMWDPEDTDAVQDAYIVMYHDGCSRHGGVDQHVRVVESELQAGGTNVHHFEAALHGFFGKLTPEQLDRLLEDTCVKVIEQDYTIRLDPKVEVPEPVSGNEFQDGAIWGLDQIDGTTDGRYQYVNNGTGVYVYIVDTGIQITHAEFQTGGGSRAVAGADFVDMSESGNSGDLLGNSCGGSSPGECSFPGSSGCTCGTIPRGMPDCSGHGTHCAGTAAGSTVGVAKGATVVAVRVLNCEGSGYTSGVVAGMDYVVRMKRDKHPSAPTVMSMSLGGARPSESYNDPSLDPKYAAVAAAKALGVTVVVAAGNSGVDVDTRSPAHIDDAITVGASNVNRQRSYFSCFGRGVDLFAPGYKVNSAVTGGDSDYAEYSGTSMATPHVAGVLALMLQHNSDWSWDQQVSELTTDCVETGSVEMLRDDLNPLSDRCDGADRDDRCNVPDSENPNNCHGCNYQSKCWSKNNYVPGSGEGDTPCGWYSQMSGECEGVCICYCGGKHCDATYLWGIWLQFCCNTYFASCEPDTVLSSPNKLTNLFGSGRCAAAIDSGSSPTPPVSTPGPTPGPSPTPPPPPTPPTPPPEVSKCTPEDYNFCEEVHCSANSSFYDRCWDCPICFMPSPTPAPPTPPPWTPPPAPAPTPYPTPSGCTPDWEDYCVERHCEWNNTLYEYCKDCPICTNPSPTPGPAPSPGQCRDYCSSPSDCTSYPLTCGGCSFCGGSPTPSPRRRRTSSPTPSPSPGNCNSVCDRPSDCTDYPSICSGCSFCGGSPGPAPTPSSPSPTPGGGMCSTVCDRPSDCTDYPSICSGCSFCGPAPSPPGSGDCSYLCDRPSDCTDYPSICSGCSFC